MQDYGIIRKWMLGDRLPDNNIHSRMRFGANYIDAQKGTGQYLGTIAVRFNNIILINSGLKFDHSAIRTMAIELGFEVIQIGPKRMIALRATLREYGVTVERPAALFRHELGPLKDRFPNLNHPNKWVNHARCWNAFYYRGRKTHVMLETIDNPSNRDDNVRVFAYYESADDGLLALLKMTVPDKYQLLEIGE